jgi:hypothetical protein
MNTEHNPLIETEVGLPGRTAVVMQPTPSKSSELKVKFSTFARAFDLTPIKYKLVREKDWTLDRAEMVEAQYKAFIFLMGTKEGRFFIPTLDIDEMWHAHILDTRKYMEDCATHFGEYIHHYPYLGMKDGDDEIRAKKLFMTTCENILDELDIDIRGLKFTCCGGGGGCSGGGSSCSSSSCSSGGGHSGCSSGSHSHCSSGHGGHGHHAPASDTPYIPVASCGTTGDTGSTRRTPERSRYTPSKPGRQPDRPPQRKGIFRRILGLSPAAADKWYASVTPHLFAPREYRPGVEELRQLTKLERCYH